MADTDFMPLTRNALPLIGCVVFIIFLALAADMLKYRTIPFRFALRVEKYRREFFNAADIVFKLVQWSLFVAVVSVASDNIQSTTLLIIDVILKIFLFGAVYSVLWSLIEARVIFHKEKSELSVWIWRLLFFSLFVMPMYDTQRFLTVAVADFVKNLTRPVAGG